MIKIKIKIIKNINFFFIFIKIKKMERNGFNDNFSSPRSNNSINPLININVPRGRVDDNWKSTGAKWSHGVDEFFEGNILTKHSSKIRYPQEILGGRLNNPVMPFETKRNMQKEVELYELSTKRKRLPEINNKNYDLQPLTISKENLKKVPDPPQRAVSTHYYNLEPTVDFLTKDTFTSPDRESLPGNNIILDAFDNIQNFALGIFSPGSYNRKKNNQKENLNKTKINTINKEQLMYQQRIPAQNRMSEKKGKEYLSTKDYNDSSNIKKIKENRVGQSFNKYNLVKKNYSNPKNIKIIKQQTTPTFNGKIIKEKNFNDNFGSRSNRKPEIIKSIEQFTIFLSDKIDQVLLPGSKKKDVQRKQPIFNQRLTDEKPINYKLGSKNKINISEKYSPTQYTNFNNVLTSKSSYNPNRPLYYKKSRDGVIQNSFIKN